MVRITLRNRDEVRLLIAKTGLSVRGFSREIGISDGYLSTILRGKQEPSPRVANKIATGLGVDMEAIFLIEMLDKTGEKEKQHA